MLMYHSRYASVRASKRSAMQALAITGTGTQRPPVLPVRTTCGRYYKVFAVILTVQIRRVNEGRALTMCGHYSIESAACDMTRP